MMWRVLVVLGVLFGAAPVWAQAPAGQVIELGRGYEIASKALGETRRVNVYLPAGYAAGRGAYPVLYLLDGGVEQDFPHIAGLSQHAEISGSFQAMIVIGIETKDRRRELTSPALSDAALVVEYPTHGEAAKFRAFIADEVKPWVEAHYRTTGTSALMGESLAGLFVAETFLKQPELFDGYVAVDPSLWWDKGALAKEAKALLGAQAFGERTLYMAGANSGPEMRLWHTMMAQAVKTAALPGVGFTYEIMDDETHGTIYHRAALQALRVVFANAPE